MTRPSYIPEFARALATQELAALIKEMEAIVSSSHLFKSLDEVGRKRVLESAYVTNFAPGDTLLREGMPGESFLLVMKGTVIVETTSPSGPVHLAELGRGACVGEVSVLTGQPRTATVTAKTEVDAAAFERHRIERVLADYPKVRSVLESLVVGRARDTIEKIVGS